MIDYFKGNENGHVLYPVGDFAISQQHAIPQPPRRPITLVYAGNCYGAYGRMLLAFAKLVKESADIRLKIFPVGKGWNDDDIAEMRAAGIYQNFMPFAELRKELASCDAFLTVMSFEKEEEPFVRTSFTTKWLDYAPFSKPIFVWAPEYSSAVAFARKYHCGAIAAEPEASTLLKVINDTMTDEKDWLTLGQKAREAADTILNPERIHGVLVKQVTRVLNSDNA
jgi:hypothetical protein